MKLEFTNEQLAILDRALQELPWRVANPLFAEINKQVAAQMPPVGTVDAAQLQAMVSEGTNGA